MVCYEQWQGSYECVPLGNNERLAMVTEASRERLAKAKEISLIGLIQEQGGKLNDNGSYYSMLSPFRSEQECSFKIDKRRPSHWKDFGNGSHGDILDYVQLTMNLSIKEAIDFLLKEDKKSLPVFAPIERDRKSIEIVSKSPIISTWLTSYLAERQIPLKIAEKYLVELEIRFNYGKHPERTSRVLGFINDAGGYEMRSKSLKISNSPKTVTTIRGYSHECINLYEGFFSFLSDCVLRGSVDQPCDAVILNSLSFLPQMLSFWGKDVFIYSHLDNDSAGNKATKLLQESGISFHDMRVVYEDYNDLNDALCGKRLAKKKSFFIKDFLRNSNI
jgi:hypothetical protein